jgi:hypothetical protein
MAFASVAGPAKTNRRRGRWFRTSQAEKATAFPAALQKFPAAAEIFPCGFPCPTRPDSSQSRAEPLICMASRNNSLQKTLRTGKTR